MMDDYGRLLYWDTDNQRIVVRNDDGTFSPWEPADGGSLVFSSRPREPNKENAVAPAPDVTVEAR